MKHPICALSSLVVLALAALPAGAQSTVVAWGDNAWGQNNVPAPPSGATFVQLAGGHWHSAALCSDGSILAWGFNQDGQCNVPAPPPGSSYVEVATGGYHTIARLGDGTATAWGMNQYGQCSLPGSGFVGVDGGEYSTVVRRSDGSVMVRGNLSQPPTGLTCVEVAVGRSHALARRSDGSVVAWGANDYGQRDVPALPANLVYVEVAAGGWHSLARRSDGSIVAWGRNDSGQCDVPALPTGLSYVEVEAGGSHSLARRSDGSVVAWGDDSSGQCDVPARPPGTAYVELAAGWNHSLARLGPAQPAATVYCTAKTNSLGCVPAIGFSGTLSPTGPDDFVISASELRNFRPGLLFWGRLSADDPFQGGVLCVAPPLVRTPLQDSGGTPGVDDCSGRFAFELTNGYLSANALIPGDELYAQYWSRDPHSPPFFTSLTDALHVWVGP